MIFSNQGLKVFVHREPVDMRKGHDGLASIVENHIKEDLLDGSVFLFINKSRRLCKALYFDGTGLVIIHKRLEIGSFMNFLAFKEYQRISISELALIFEGASIRLQKSPKKFSYGSNKRRSKNKS